MEEQSPQMAIFRERLVTTREEERRRLRRDLHDGLGPRLATLTVKVSAAQNHLHRNPEAAGRLLAAFITGLDEDYLNSLVWDLGLGDDDD